MSYTPTTGGGDWPPRRAGSSSSSASTRTVDIGSSQRAIPETFARLL